MFLNSNAAERLDESFPFTWSQTGFKYLGIQISPFLKDLFQIDYMPLFDKIKEELEYWILLLILFLGGINIIKMTIFNLALCIFTNHCHPI